MLKRTIINILAAILGLYIAVRFIPGVSLNGSISSVFIFGAFLGIVNSFIKPVLKIIAFPLTILTLGIFGLVIDLLLVFIVIDVLSPIEISGFIALISTTFIIWLAGFIISMLT